MPMTDFHAATTVRDLRESAGKSQEALARDIRRMAETNGWFRVHGAVDAFTIRRIERDGHCPSERVRFVIALYFGQQPRDIWRPENRRPVAA